MNIKKENIQNFIDYNPYYQKPKEIIRTFLMGLLLLGLPTAIFGAYSITTRVVMLPIIAWLCIWGINILKKSLNFNMLDSFLCAIFMFYSLSILILTYKFFGASNSRESLILMGLILVLYIITIGLYIMSTIKRIKRGYYNKQEQFKNIDWIWGCIAAFMIPCGRKILGAIDRNILDNIMLGMFLFAAFACAYGATVYFLKYYFAKMLEKQDM